MTRIPDRNHPVHENFHRIVQNLVILTAIDPFTFCPENRIIILRQFNI